MTENTTQPERPHDLGTVDEWVRYQKRLKAHGHMDPSYLEAEIRYSENIIGKRHAWISSHPKPEITNNLVGKIEEIAQRDDVSSFSCPYDNRQIWLTVIQEQTKRKIRLDCDPQSAFSLYGPDSGICSLSPDTIKGRIHVPYEGICKADIFIVPRWRELGVFFDKKNNLNRISLLKHCRFVICEVEVPDVQCANKERIDNWIFYESAEDELPSHLLHQVR